MNTATDPILGPLLNSGLALLAPAVPYILKGIYEYLKGEERLPTPPKWVFLVLMVAIAFGLALANKQFDTNPPTTLTELWYVQGIIFFGVILGVHLLNEKMYGTSSVAFENAGTKVLPVLAAAGLLFAGDAFAQPARIGLARLAGGVGIGAHAYESTPSVTRADVPVSGWLAYSLAERLSLHGSVAGGFVHSLGEARGALHVEIDNQGDTKVSAGAFVSDYFGGGAHGMEQSSGWGVFLEPARVLSRDASGAAKTGAFVRLYSDFDNGPGALVGVKLLVFGGRAR